MKDILTTFEVAKLLNLSPYTIRYWIEKGLLNAFRTPGGHRRVKLSDLMEFLKENKMPLPKFEDRKKRVAIYYGLDIQAKSVIKKLLKKIMIIETSNPFVFGYLVEKEKPDIIFFDLDNWFHEIERFFELLCESKSAMVSIPIGISKIVNEEIFLKAQKFGFCEVLQKPLQEKELKDLVSKIYSYKSGYHRLKRSK